MFKEKGSIAIETAISLTITMAAVLTIMLFARIVYVHGVVQHALVQTANEMSSYSYLYSITGLNELNKKVISSANAGGETVNAAFETSEKAIDNVSKVLTNFTGGKYGDAAGNIPGAVQSVKNLGSINIIEVLKGFCSAAGGEALNVGKTTAMNFVTRSLMRTYLPHYDNNSLSKFFKVGMFVDDNGKYIKEGDDAFPIDLSYSEYFTGSNGDEISIVAVYDIKFATPIPIINKPITIAQTAKSRAWMSKWTHKPKGGGESEEDDEYSVWDETDSVRAEKIAASNKALNLHKNFNTIRGFNKSTGKASMFITIDVRKQSYSTTAAIKSKIQSKVTSLENFESYTLNGTKVTDNDIKSVDYYVYVPEGEKKKAQDAASSIKTVTLKNGKEVKVNVIVKEVK